MKYFDWDKVKNDWLKDQRGVSFEEVVSIVEEGRVLDTIDHPNKNKYPTQKLLIVDIEEYVYIVPFIEDEEKIFFKTIIPSRKMTKKYLFKK